MTLRLRSLSIFAALACSSTASDAPDFGPAPGASSVASDGAIAGLGFVPDTPDDAAAFGAACGGTIFEPERSPLDMYFLVDSSGSMAQSAGQGASKWDLVSAALVDFLSAPQNAELGVGVGYFPEDVTLNCNASGADCLCIPVINICFANAGGSCAPDDYATPAVPLALTPVPGAAIASIRARELAGGTPTRAALEGTYRYLETWASQNPGRKLAVVLATDGEPTGCVDNVPAEAARLAAEALASPHPVQTFVIGVGDDLDNLDEVARAGGTSRALLIDASQDLARDFADALESIRGSATPCTFEIPASTEAGPVDPGRVNVRFTPSGAAQAVAVGKTFDGSANGCGPEGGWYYDDPAAPTRIQLCGTSCQGALQARVDVQFGCESIVQPPR